MIEANLARLWMMLYIMAIWPFNYHIDGEIHWQDNQIILVRGGDRIFYKRG